MEYKRIEIAQSDIDEQKRIMALVAQINQSKPRQQYALVDTYGCQQNESDSERLRGMLKQMGYELTDDEFKADIIVMNTCAVREHAEKRVFGNVGRLTHTKKANPEQIIALCGCMVQQPTIAEKIKKSYRIVDLVFGPQVLWRFPELLYQVITKNRRVFSIEQEQGCIAEDLPRVRDDKTKAWLSIMYGCNNFCSYCIVPYVRGRERSRRPEVILQEAQQLVQQGYKDITLLGQNVNSYGKDLEQNIDFSDILKMINDIPGDFIIRFMTSHPKDAGEKLFKTMAECEKVAKHIHLPFQAGNDRILQLMNRRYTKNEYLALVDLARSYMPDVIITSDIIVGFPGETYEEFCDTLDVIKRVRFDALFTFIYSKRTGTPAAQMPDDTPKQEKQRRFDELLQVQNTISEQKHRQYVGKTLRALVTGKSDNDSYPLDARTNGGRLIHTAGPEQAIGKFVNVKITDSNTWALFGEIIDKTI